LVTHFSPPFLQCIARHARTLAEDSFGCQFVTEVILSSTGDKSLAISAVAAVAAGDPRAEGHIANDAAGARMLKTLVTGGHFCTKEKSIKRTPAQPSPTFHPHRANSKDQWRTHPSSSTPRCTHT
jgi:pumilio family protein 6